MKQIGFTNFRKFEQFPVLDINDITFIVGSNNSGKSTMVKAILLVYDNLRSLRTFQKDGKWEVPKFKFDANKTRDLHIGTFWRALNNRAKERGDESITFVATLSQITYEIKVNCNLNHDDDLYETMAPIACITITDHKNHARIVIDYAKNQLSAVVGMNGNAPQTISDSLDKFISFAYNNDMVNRLYALSITWEGREDNVKLTITDVLASLSDNYIEYFYAHGVTQKIVYSYEDRNDYIASIIHEYENERKYSVQVTVIVYVLFLLGVLMSYFVLFPISFRFLGTYSVSARVVSNITLDSYVTTFVSLTLVMGLVFQLPVIAFFLGKLGFISSETLTKYRKHAIIIIMLMAAIITPPDLMTLILVTIPLYLLYEVSIRVVKWIE